MKDAVLYCTFTTLLLPYANVVRQVFLLPATLSPLNTASSRPTTVAIVILSSAKWIVAWVLTQRKHRSHVEADCTTSPIWWATRETDHRSQSPQDKTIFFKTKNTSLQPTTIPYTVLYACRLRMTCHSSPSQYLRGGCYHVQFPEMPNKSFTWCDLLAMKGARWASSFATIRPGEEGIAIAAVVGWLPRQFRCLFWEFFTLSAKIPDIVLQAKLTKKEKIKRKLLVQNESQQQKTCAKMAVHAWAPVQYLTKRDFLGYSTRMIGFCKLDHLKKHGLVLSK